MLKFRDRKNIKRIIFQGALFFALMSGFSCIIGGHQYRCYEAGELYVWFIAEQKDTGYTGVRAYFSKDYAGGILRRDLCSNYEVTVNGSVLGQDIILNGTYYTTVLTGATTQYQFIVTKDGSPILDNVFTMPEAVNLTAPADGSSILLSQDLITQWTLPATGGQTVQVYWRSAPGVLTSQDTTGTSSKSSADNGQYTIPAAYVVRQAPTDTYFRIFAQRFAESSFSNGTFLGGLATMQNSAGNILNLLLP